MTKQWNPAQSVVNCSHQTFHTEICTAYKTKKANKKHKNTSFLYIYMYNLQIAQNTKNKLSLHHKWMKFNRSLFMASDTSCHEIRKTINWWSVFRAPFRLLHSYVTRTRQIMVASLLKLKHQDLWNQSWSPLMWMSPSSVTTCFFYHPATNHLEVTLHCWQNVTIQLPTTPAINI